MLVPEACHRPDSLTNHGSLLFPSQRSHLTSTTTTTTAPPGGRKVKNPLTTRTEREVEEEGQEPNRFPPPPPFPRPPAAKLYKVACGCLPPPLASSPRLLLPLACGSTQFAATCASSFFNTLRGSVEKATILAGCGRGRIIETKASSLTKDFKETNRVPTSPVPSWSEWCNYFLVQWTNTNSTVDNRPHYPLYSPISDCALSTIHILGELSCST